jgi:cation diffusion facilitator family transporter
MAGWLGIFEHVPRIERRAAVCTLLIGVALTGVKFFAYAVTGSAAIFSDAVESIVNILTGAFGLYALAVAHAPADPSHPYGHGKVEFVSGAVEGGMILFAGGMVMWNAVAEYLRGAGVSQIQAGTWLIALTAVANLLMGRVLIGLGKGRSSLTIEASGRHLLSDAVTSGGVLVALVLVAYTGAQWLDPLCALVCGGFLLWTGAGLLRRATAGLMDEQDAADDRLLRALLDAHVAGEMEPRICSYHKLRHRHAGRMHWVDFHMLVPAGVTVFEGHQVACLIETELEKALGEADATAHVEPCVGEGCVRCGKRG